MAILQCAPALASAMRPDWAVPRLDFPAVSANSRLRPKNDGSILARDTIAAGAVQPEKDARAAHRELLVRRRRQYAEVFASVAVVLLLMTLAARSFNRRDGVGVGLAALGALGIGALLQFSATSAATELMWPPPRWWLGTFAGTFMLAVMFAAVAAVLIHPGLLRILVTVLIAEGVWWSVTQPLGVDWLVFVGTAAGALAAPAAAWALASLCSMVAERVVPARTCT
jgi:hypothetical protein